MPMCCTFNEKHAKSLLEVIQLHHYKSSEYRLEAGKQFTFAVLRTIFPCLILIKICTCLHITCIIMFGRESLIVIVKRDLC
jgi:hypothetical protein